MIEKYHDEGKKQSSYNVGDRSFHSLSAFAVIVLCWCCDLTLKSSSSLRRTPTGTKKSSRSRLSI